MIIIIGAGIAGLSLGYELAKRGAKVTVLEAGTIACGASGIATSYLEPRLGKTAMRAVEWEALRRWESYAGEIQDASGIDVEFQTSGQLRVTIAENAQKFEKDLEDRQNQGWQLEMLSQDEVLKLEPSLSREITQCVFLPQVRWVTGRKLCHALAESISRLGGAVIENSPVVSIAPASSGVTVTTSSGEAFSGEQLALCHTMLMNQIEGVPTDVLSSRAVRGVNLVLDQSSLPSQLRHLIKHHRGNLCPRDNGELIVGTTYEPGETSLEPDGEVIEKLYENAEPILPKLRDLPVKKITAGLRTKIGDGTLKLGRSRANPGVHYSLSHAGAGYLRAPVVAPELAEFLLEGRKGQFTGFVTSD